MLAVQLTAAGLDSHSIIEVPAPEPGPHEVLLGMKAASCNFRDFAIAMGKYPGVKYPLIPLSDGVGIVEAVGARVKRLKLGDRVAPIFAPRWFSGPPSDATAPGLGGELDGVLRQKLVIDEQAGVIVPGHLSDAEAATLPCAGVTAWSALVGFGRVKPGDTVLIEGTGGVALFALQFAKLAGARVALVSSSDEKLERARVLGADMTLNYRETPEWGAPIAKLTGGIDVVIETVGATTLAQALVGIKKGGRVASVGLLSGVAASLPLHFFIPRGVIMQGIVVGGRDQFENMVRAIAQHKLQPVVAERFGFDDLKPALGQMAPGASHFGKITIEIAS